MNLSTRSKLSLCQFLCLFGSHEIILLSGKHEFQMGELEAQPGPGFNANTVRSHVEIASSTQLGGLLQEIARTHNSMRTNINPKYKFDERWEDLKLCLELDGFRLAPEELNPKLEKFVPIEPMIEGMQPIEDDLTIEIRKSNLPETEEVCRVLGNSADAFIQSDFNGCLTNARVALQTLATSIAKARQVTCPGNFDSTKWGQIVDYLRTSNFITSKEEEGLTGVFSFISPGSHIPVGFTEQEFVRLGRSLTLSMCYFLAKRWNGEKP